MTLIKQNKFLTIYMYISIGFPRERCDLGNLFLTQKAISSGPVAQTIHVTSVFLKQLILLLRCKWQVKLNSCKGKVSLFIFLIFKTYICFEKWVRLLRVKRPAYCLYEHNEKQVATFLTFKLHKKWTNCHFFSIELHNTGIQSWFYLKPDNHLRFST